MTTAFSAVVVIADTPIASVGGVQFEAAFQHEDPAAVWELTPFSKTNQVYQAVIEITGDDPGPVVWSVEGTDKDLFNIDSSTGKVTFSKAVTLDYETKSSYSFTVVATVGGMAFRQDVSLMVRNVDIEGTHGRTAQDFDTENLDGTNKAEVIFGLDGADTINGGAGNDTLRGGAGRDVLYGGISGQNQLYGGNGADLFVLNRHNVGGEVTATDIIKDFDRAEGDRIRIETINAKLDEVKFKKQGESLTSNTVIVKEVSVGERKDAQITFAVGIRHKLTLEGISPDDITDLSDWFVAVKTGDISLFDPVPDVI